MAYNTYSNNKDANEPKKPTTYSFALSNTKSELDKTCLKISYWKEMMRITIAPQKENTEEAIFDMDKGLTVYLNHIKARILANEIKNFLRDPDTYNGCGIPTNQGVITISNGSEFGHNAPVLVIRKLDDVGHVVSSFAYEFVREYYHSVRNYTGGTDFIRETAAYNTIEIEALIGLLEEYCRAATNAVAHTVMTAGAYNHSRMQNSINAIAEKLGVEVNRTSNKGGSYSSTTNFFNNAGRDSREVSSGYASATLDDID